MKKNFGTKLLSMFLVILMMVSIVPMSTISVSAAVGHTQAEAVAWAKQQIGKSLDYDGYYGAQCVDLIAYYYKYLGTVTPGGNGCDYATNKLPNGWSRIAYNKNNVQPGDIIVWKTTTYKKNGSTVVNKYGHVAIALSNNNGNITFAEQGQSWGGVVRSKTGIYNSPSSIVRPNFSDLKYNVQNGFYKTNQAVDLTMSGETLLTIPKDTYVRVINNNGSGSPLGYTARLKNGSYVYGWVDTTKCTKVNIDPVSTPVVKASKTQVAVNESVTLDFKTLGACWYYVYQDGNLVYNGQGSSYITKGLTAGEHTFYVLADDAGQFKSLKSNVVTVTAASPKTVTFVGANDEVLSTQTVDYNKDATAPLVNAPEGYLFNGWDKGFANVTTDLTVKATFIKKLYTVNFYGPYDDSTGEYELLKTQTVPFGEDATPPTDTKDEIGYEFSGWNSEAYKNVYIADGNKINIYASYGRINGDLPIYTYNLTACRDKSTTGGADGYNVEFTIKNLDENVIKGRAIITLKTAEGKLISTTESASFKLAKNGTKTFSEFIDSEKAATVVEVLIVNGISTGVPISANVSAQVSSENMWSDWQDTMPTGSDIEVDTPRTLYRSRTKITSTNSTKALQGYIWDGTFTSKTSTGSTYDVVNPIDTESQKRTVTTAQVFTGYAQKLIYKCFHYRVSGTECWPYYKSGYVLHEWTSSSPATYYTSKTYSGDGKSHSVYKVDGKNMWCSQCNSSYLCWYDQTQEYVNDTSKPQYKTRYDYTDTFYTYNFYKWSDWSDWSVTPISETDNVQVDTKQQYRYYASALNLEDNSGIERTISGTLSTDLAGKQLSLFIYKYADASDYTDEFVGQTVVGSDGSYSFTFKLREEPTAKTGDFTVALGIEGESVLKIIDTIEAPKPVYTVNFRDGNGNIISTQNVTEGHNAVVPETPVKLGYKFLYWDQATSNVRSNLEIKPVYEQEEYTIIFVDWQQQTVETQKVKSGEIIVPPEIELLEGYSFLGWDMIGENAITATKDMVITAEYKANTYNIKFMDVDGKTVLSEQEVAYGDTALMPTESKTDATICDFINADEFQRVNHDAVIYPEYYFDETTSTPVANYETGEYANSINVTFTTEDEDAVIYYSINGSEEEQEYTGPVTIDKTCSITAHAESLGKNNSGEVTYYYCINSTTASDWMEYKDLPDYVIENLSMYNLEEDTISKYKYVHYKYTDSNGVVQYSPTTVNGFDCTYEEILLDSRLSIEGFTDNNTSYYIYDNQTWFTQTRTSVTVYSYSNKPFHIVSLAEGDYLSKTMFVQHGKTIDTSELEDVYGYYFNGLYNDFDLTDEFDELTKITESKTLFVSYTPKKYTVTFQMQDGTELDVQTVEYLSSAEEPDTDSVKGWVFAGWDKDFSEITENTIVTGKYVKEVNYALVKVSAPKLMMYVGNYAKLSATVTDATSAHNPMANQEVVWASTDYNVASVDENGNIKAVGPGKASIIATVTSSGETSTCEVTVNADISTSIILSGNAEIGMDSERNVRVTPSNASTVADIKAQFENDDLVFYSKDGNILADTDIVTTETVIKLEYNNNNALDEVTIVFTGDFNCDGYVDNKDVVMINQYVLEKRAADRYQMIAIDVNGDGSVNNRDCAMLSRYLVGKTKI